jgi:hypothetical protein
MTGSRDPPDVPCPKTPSVGPRMSTRTTKRSSGPAAPVKVAPVTLMNPRTSGGNCRKMLLAWNAFAFGVWPLAAHDLWQERCAHQRIGNGIK